ncbi:SusD/RagB family nutrient-binding outer membrane lipoprotein [Chitinophaga sp. Cy-1792]|uniref:SusD/RagB family nutrient-binding outer membrane lipoprotein n=1 Tax=Chitinophaga sp. Cy-1792 TaxID=2608339 RepID=UPI001422BB16|nr:SusD/RagB family nutrient-binding outer membrane lipoprotein [Chitinophaga sp. Cy-1792]
MKKVRYILLGGLLVAAAGCTKGFLDINQDPNNPTKVTLPQMLPTCEQGLAYCLGYSNSNRGAIGLSEVLGVYMHQVTVRESQDQYGATGSQFDINGAWTQFYSAQATNGNGIIGFLQNTDVLIKQADDGGNKVYSGIGRVMKAYGMSQFVDAFADVPYSEANQFSENGNGYPHFDKGADIYPQLLALLDTAIVNLATPNGLVPKTDDVIFGGNINSWRKTAKSIKLKLLVQQRLVKDVSADVSALISGGDLISSTATSFMMPYGAGTSPDDRNPGYNDYYATQRSHYQSPWFYEILKGYRAPFNNIEDPRIPYYFFNQNTAGDAAQNITDYRDGAFISILFGSSGPGRDGSQDKSMTVFGMYPVGGRFDQNYYSTGGAGDDTLVVTSTSATGAAPLRMLTYADVLYLQAECINTGLVAGDERTVLKNAIQESFNMVDLVVTRAKGAQDVPSFATTDAAKAKTYIDKVMAVYDGRGAGSPRLELIMTQKWIQSFGFSCDQYSDYRRTGFPVLFDPNNPSQAPGGFFQPPINGDPTHPGAQPKVPVSCGRKYPLSLPWPTDELNVNRNAPAQKLPDSYPVFWDK